MTMDAAKTLTFALKGKWHGHYGMARCPAHTDRSPSLKIDQRGDLVLVHCHAGCPQTLVIDTLRALGLWEGIGAGPRAEAPQRRPRTGREQDEAQEKIDRASRLWRGAAGLSGSLAERYLRFRGIDTTLLPPDLAFTWSPHPEHPKSAPYPCLIALITEGGRWVGVQRTFLHETGLGKASIRPAKITNGVLGHGTVQCNTYRVEDILGLAEGVETALSAQQLFALPVWATLGCSRMDKIRLPSGVKRLLIFADNNDAGRQAAERAVRTYSLEGVDTSIALPPVGDGDWNNTLQRRGDAREHRASEQDDAAGADPPGTGLE